MNWFFKILRLDWKGVEQSLLLGIDRDDAASKLFGGDDNKPDDPPVDDNKPDDKKPDDPPVDDNKPDDKKPDDPPVDDNKPDDKKPDDPPVDDNKPDDKKPDDPPADDKKPDDKPPKEVKLDFPKDSLSSQEQTEFMDFVKAEKLTQEGAQKLLDTQIKFRNDFVKDLNEKAKAQAASWEKDARSDKEIGGDKFEGNLKLAKNAMEHFATQDFRDFLESTKMGNHPGLLRVFTKIGQEMANDSFVRGSGGGTVKKDHAEILYGDSNKEK